MNLNLKKIICLFFGLTIYFYSTNINAQAPNAIPYQGVARNTVGNILSSQTIRLRISIHNLNTTGNVIYSEAHIITTNSLGLFSINIGQGIPLTGLLGNINWNDGAKFLQVEMDATGGTNYIDMGTQQFMSVPYALFSANSANNIISHNVGESYGGGIVFYTYDNGQHGLIAATSDQLFSCQNCSYSIGNSGISGKNAASGIGAGQKNTLIAVAEMQASSYFYSTYNIFFACYFYNSTVNGVVYGDWYLPSKYELYLMYQQKNLLGMNASYYWSSNAYQTAGLYPQFVPSLVINFQNGNEYNDGAVSIYTNAVRAIRCF